MPVKSFRELTGYQPPGWRGRQPGGISPLNHSLCEVEVVRGKPWDSLKGFPGIFSLQTLTKFDKRWVYYGCSLLTNNKYTEKGVRGGGAREVCLCSNLDFNSLGQVSMKRPGYHWGVTDTIVVFLTALQNDQLQFIGFESVAQWTHWTITARLVGDSVRKRLISTIALIFNPTNWTFLTRQ